jgi:hypothetical protein
MISMRNDTNSPDSPRAAGTARPHLPGHPQQPDLRPQGVTARPGPDGWRKRRLRTATA